MTSARDEDEDVREREYVVYGFASTHDAIAAETALAKGGVAFRMIPTPKELGELCGIAIRVLPDETAGVEATLGDAGISWSARAEMSDVWDGS